ncbi:MAG: hypothetical protein E7624_03225 [Ruminococcaceae bacterium]|nr:hypothetical protein [Oscillospiraceae bacterium]
MANSKSERHFNLLDAVLILLAILAIVGVWQRNNLKNLFAKKELMEPYIISFEVKRVRSTTADLLTKGVEFYTADGHVALGALTQQVATSAATVYLPHPDPEKGTVEAVYPQDEYEYLLDVSGELSCLGIEREQSFFVGGELLLVKGQEIRVQTETVDLIITITGYKKLA